MELEHKINEQISKLERVQKRLELEVNILNNYDKDIEYKILSQDHDALFQKNISAFQHFLPALYQELSAHKPEKWAFKCNTNRSISLESIQGDEAYYANSPYAISLSQFISFSKYPQAFRTIWAKENEEHIIEDFAHQRDLNKLVELYNQAENEPRNDVDDDPAADINTLVVLGIGLGLHLDMIVTNTSLRTLVVYEPDLDMLYASLYVTDWCWIFDTINEKNINFHLSVGINDEDFAGDLGRQFKNNLWHENVICHVFNHRPAAFSGTIDALKKEFNRYFVGYGFFDDALLGIAHQVGNLKNNVPFLPTRNIHYRGFNDIPVFLVLNGPSLDESIETIKKFREKAIVVAGGSVLGTLYKYGIKPDIFVSMERCGSTMELIEATTTEEYRKDILLLTLNVIHPDTSRLFEKSAVIVKGGEAGSTLFVNALNNKAGKRIVNEFGGTNPTVANAMAAWMTRLGFDTFYLFGCDLASIDDKHHSSQSMYYDKDGNDLDLFELSQEKKLPFEGNFGDPVHCSSLFMTSRFVLESVISTTYKDASWFNTSRGVRIEGTTPLQHEKINLITELDKDVIKDEIYSRVEEPNLYLTADEYIDELSLDLWENYTQDLINFCEQASSVTTRKEAADFMRVHWDKMVDDRFPGHFKLSFRGTFHYYQSVIFTTLYTANNSKWHSLFVQSYGLFAEHLKECKRRLRTHVFSYSNTHLVDVPGFEDMEYN